MIRSSLISAAFILITFSVTFGQSGGGWLSQNSGTSLNLNDVCFIDANTCWIVGEHGKILNTLDGGDHWSGQNSGTTEDLHAVFFIDSQKGWAVGTSGTVLHTRNGGADWTAQTINISSFIKSVYFVNDTTGWLCGDSFPSVYRTTDGGINWSSAGSDEYRNNSIFFLDENTGWVAGPGVAASDDGGVTWTPCNVNLNSHSVFFINGDNGWVVGSPYDAFKTENGGTTWSSMTMTSCLWLNDIFFIDQNHGWTVGDGVYKTVNGGTSWEKVRSGTVFSAVCFVDTLTGWVVGENGEILKTISGGAAAVNENSGQTERSASFFLKQNYPNPFNPVTKIGYILQKSGRITLTVCNLSGQRIETLFTGFQTAGEHEISWKPNGLPAGIYFYRLQTGEYTVTKKLILQK